MLGLFFVSGQGELRAVDYEDIIDYEYDERFKKLFFVTKVITGSVTNVTNVTVEEE